MNSEGLCPVGVWSFRQMMGSHSRIAHIAELQHGLNKDLNCINIIVEMMGVNGSPGVPVGGGTVKAPGRWLTMGQDKVRHGRLHSATKPLLF